MCVSVCACVCVSVSVCACVSVIVCVCVSECECVLIENQRDINQVPNAMTQQCTESKTKIRKKKAEEDLWNH